MIFGGLKNTGLRKKEEHLKTYYKAQKKKTEKIHEKSSTIQKVQNQKISKNKKITPLKTKIGLY